MVESALELVGDLVAFRSSGHSTHAFIIFIFLGRARWVFRSLLLLRRACLWLCVLCVSLGMGEEHHAPEYIQLLYCLWLLFEKRTLALEQSNKQTHKHAHTPPPSRHDAPPDKKKSEIRKSGARKMSISRANFFFFN